MSLLFSKFNTNNAILSEKLGGSAEAFRQLGQKWKVLPDEEKEEYNKKAREAPKLKCSDSERVSVILKSITKEVLLDC